MKELLGYDVSYKKFDTTLHAAIDLSRYFADIPSPSGKHFYASVLFTRLCVKAMSLKKLSPHPELLGKNAHWDYASVCSITRNIVECYLIFYYLCVQAVDDKEWEARWRLFNVHDCLSRDKMFKSTNLVPDEEAEKVISITLDELKANDYFRTFTLKQQQHYLKGNDALFLSQDQIVQSYGGDVEEFRFLYRFLSNQVHSLPMSFYRVDEQVRGRGIESDIEVNYTSLCLGIAQEYIEKAYKDYNNIFQSIERVTCR
jgi:hypothetical protein